MTFVEYLLIMTAVTFSETDPWRFHDVCANIGGGGGCGGGGGVGGGGGGGGGGGVGGGGARRR